MSLVQFVCILFWLFSTSFAYRILIVYPTPAFSHQRGQLAITQKLAENGHEIILVGPFGPLQSHPNIRHFNISGLWETKKEFQKMADINLTKLDLYLKWKNVSCNMIRAVMESKIVQTELLHQKNQSFDAVIVELLGFTTLHAFAPYFNASLIGISSIETLLSIHRVRGNPTHPILHSGNVVVRPLKPNLWERLRLFYTSLVSYFGQTQGFYKEYDKLTKKFFNSSYSSLELIQMVDLHIEEVSPVLYSSRPLLPHTVQIGFMHIEAPKPLPEDLENFMNSSKDGVIYVSLGSTVTGKNIGKHLIDIFKVVFASVSYDVLWKFETTHMDDKPKNVKLMNWVPQTDLLAHKNIKLFITQGGSQSMEEFIARGVPAIAVPFFADQEYNAVRIEQLGVGKCIFKRDLSIKRLREAIHEVIGNSTYKNSATELYRRACDTPKPPVETAVWWIEYTIRNRGAEHLKYAGAEMPWYQWFLLDIFLIHVLGGCAVTVAALISL